ncbi:CBS domain-containing protein [archaeon SCG-AAA382B04]|nr:CBS domain-containing protein [archaeon SCG-AAA382B04]
MEVKEIMTKDVVVAEVPGTIEGVLDKFRNGDHSGLPVVKKDSKKVVGVITRSDLLNNQTEDQIAMIMTRDPVVIQSNKELEEATELLLKNNIRRLPVVDEEELTGILSVADLVEELAKEDIDGEIGEYMEENYASTWVETPIPIVGKIMSLAEKDAIPILGNKGELVGVVSDTDLVKAFKREDGLDKSDMGAASDEDQWTWDGMRDTMEFYYEVSKLTLPNYPVKEIMTEEVKTTYKGSNVKEAAQKMSFNQIEQLPVLDESERLIGMVRDRNLIKTFLN